MTKEQQEQTKNDVSTGQFTEKNLTKEDTWAVSKNVCSLFHQRKERAETIGEQFRQAFLKEVLTSTTICGCVRAAREYQIAYLVAHSEELPATCDDFYEVEDLWNKIEPVKLKQVSSKQKAYKSH